MSLCCGHAGGLSIKFTRKKRGYCPSIKYSPSLISAIIRLVGPSAMGFSSVRLINPLIPGKSLVLAKASLMRSGLLSQSTSMALAITRTASQAYPAYKPGLRSYALRNESTKCILSLLISLSTSCPATIQCGSGILIPSTNPRGMIDPPKWLR